MLYMIHLIFTDCSINYLFKKIIKMTAMYFAGCEGGASHSSVVIVDQDGNVLGEASGEGTNSCLIGKI